ncbi:MazG nucleotide pyrophosphohydrolase domain-containing protein [Geopsychrobacter electrodiphilus]|uniref:MazG nucleotide pyrophosphohydrolase domain-containing protein n=1 Tax=Geopsychrobacter electrodiphilus TaxID=225196 RepID=UPI00037120B2|nr:MazG nucleotide pyrophosphohydrolase domain-containing protein [Geopsychrobacter electrodiphilus]
MNAQEMDQMASLVKTMRHLRSADGCDWDRNQTPESLRPYILEEAYELVDAIEKGDPAEILAELGDLLLQVIFQAQIYSERGLFGIGAIAESIDQKLKRRHPHIFALTDTDEEYPDWEQIKQLELKAKGQATTFGARQPLNLPALKLADKWCRQQQKNSGHNKSTLPPRVDEQQNIQQSPESISAAIFKLVKQAQQQNIDTDLALRRYVLNLALKADQNGQQ